MSAPLLSARVLQIGYGSRSLLPPIDLEIVPGEMVAVIGRNGSGKSTLLRTLLGLQAPLAGTVALARPDLRRTLMAQRFAVEPHSPLTAAEVVAWGRLRNNRFWGLGLGREVRSAVAAALEAAAAADLADRRFAELSEGEKQRVLFARLLCAEPELAFLDEPTAAMDEPAERAAMAMLATLRSRGVGIVVVSHYVDLAAAHADRILFLDRDCGEVLVGGVAEVTAAPSFRRHYVGEVQP